MNTRNITETLFVDVFEVRGPKAFRQNIRVMDRVMLNKRYGQSRDQVCNEMLNGIARDYRMQRTSLRWKVVSARAVEKADKVSAKFQW